MEQIALKKCIYAKINTLDWAELLPNTVASENIDILAMQKAELLNIITKIEGV